MHHPFFALAAAIGVAMSAFALAPVTAAPTTQSAKGQSAKGQSAKAAPRERVVRLEGGQNFRDLGGYRTADGGMVKWGVLFRSGAMDGLTDNDFRTLSRMGIRTVCDFRDTRERGAAPVKWPVDTMPRILADDYRMEAASMFGALAKPGMNGPKTRALMASFYREIPTRFGPAYRRMFAELAAGRAPLAFNCSAGKDRTGVAAALLLTAPGVRYETVLQDYLLSNRYFDAGKARQGDDQTSLFFRRLPPEVIDALMGVDRSYLDAAFDAIRKSPGGLDGYYRTQLGIDAGIRRKLRALYVTPPRR